LPDAAGYRGGNAAEPGAQLLRTGGQELRPELEFPVAERVRAGPGGVHPHYGQDGPQSIQQARSHGDRKVERVPGRELEDRALPICLPSLRPVDSGFMAKITGILNAIDQGDPHAAEQLLPLVYDELRRLAAEKMAQERPGQTLQATALVHEAYVRLVDVEKVQ